jgi:UDP-N-acetylmuramate dehydrogenase
MSNAECAFDYRGSIFKREDGRYVVVRAAFKLSSLPAPNISYKDLSARFGEKSPELMQIRDAILEIRANKFPDLSIEGSAGSFFKNPILPEIQAKALAKKYPGMPLFSLPESSDIKVPLGWFLDFRHGVMDLRDVGVGGARMYEKHFLVLAATKNTSSSDVKKLAQLVQQKVLDTLGVAIEPEVKIV